MRWATTAAFALAALAFLAGPAAALQVAVLDTGVDGDHAELTGRVAHRGFTGRPSPPVPVPPLPGVPDSDDPDGHGTAAASVVAGSTLGIAPNATVLDMQVRAGAANLPVDTATEDAAIEALDEVLRSPGNGTDGVRVVLLSFADTPMREAGAETMAAQARHLVARGVAVVVPAGPAGALHESPFVLVVAQAGSCGGEGSKGKPDLAAAESATVALPAGLGPTAPTTAQASGAHLAAARVAGALALLLEARPELPIPALYDLVRDSAGGGAGTPDGCGFGTLDVPAALAAARLWRDPLDTPAPAPRGSPVPTLAIVAVALVAAALARRQGF